MGKEELRYLNSKEEVKEDNGVVENENMKQMEQIEPEKDQNDLNEV